VAGTWSRHITNLIDFGVSRMSGRPDMQRRV
jgi:hypothetical protein